MREGLLEAIPPIAPLDFFSLEKEIFFCNGSPFLKRLRKKYQLPDLSELLQEEAFAEGWMAWSEEGICVDFSIQHPFKEATYPHFNEGDAVELFIDTRDLKTAGFATRFCHHFLFL